MTPHRKSESLERDIRVALLTFAIAVAGLPTKTPSPLVKTGEGDRFAVAYLEQQLLRGAFAAADFSAQHAEPTVQHAALTSQHVCPPLSQHGDPGTQQGAPATQQDAPASQHGEPGKQQSAPGTQQVLAADDVAFE